MLLAVARRLPPSPGVANPPGIGALQQCLHTLAPAAAAPVVGAAMPRAAVATAAVVSPLPDGIRTQVHEAVTRAFDGVASDRLFVAPNLPPERLATAGTSMGGLAPNEVPLVLFDESIQQDGQAGFLLTDRRLSWTSVGTWLTVPLAQLHDVGHGGNRLTAQCAAGELVLDLALLTRAQVDALMLALSLVRQFTSGGTDTDLRRITRAMVLDVGGRWNRSEGTLALTGRVLIWLSDDGDSIRSEVGNLTGLRWLPDLGRLRFLDSGIRAEIEVGDTVREWSRDLDEAVARARPSVSESQLAEVLARRLQPHASDTFHVLPRLPQSAVQEVAASYYSPEAGETIIALHATGRRRSANTGFCLTDSLFATNVARHSRTAELGFGAMEEIATEAGALLLTTLAGPAVIREIRLKEEALQALVAALTDASDQAARRYRSARPEASEPVAAAQTTGAPTVGSRILKAGKVTVTEFNGEAVEKEGGLLVLTNQHLLWAPDYRDDLLVSVVTDLKGVWKHLLGGAFTIEFHERQGGVLGLFGLSGNESLTFDLRAETPSWLRVLELAIQEVQSTPGSA